jgi:pilus retraction protein PilT
MSTANGIKQILQSLENWNASDLFLTEGKVPAARIHGALRQADLPMTTHEDLQAFLDEALTPAARQRFEQTGDLDAGYSLDAGKRFRFAIYRQQGLISMVIRALPSGELTFEELGLPAAVAEFADLPRGLVLFTGATGAGKSTTLAAIVHHINTSRCAHVVTIEDPIEFIHQDIKARISQREVNADTESFHVALRSVVRQSPDVIIIGEMRDLETMRVAIAAALTGHLVMATLHTIDVPQSLQRILSYFPEHLRAQAALDLSLCLKGVVSQRLLPRAEGDGRVLAAEVLGVSPAAGRLIQDQRIEEFQDFMKTSGDANVVTFNNALLKLYRDKKISYDIGTAYASNAEEFSLMAQGMSSGVSSFAEEGVAGASGLDMQALLRMTNDKGASDLHMTVGRPPIFRINGALYPLKVKPLSTVDMRMLLHSIMSVRQRTAFELERELDFALSLEQGKRFRVNAYHQKGLMAASLRAIPSEIPDADALGLPDIVLQMGQRPQGLLLVVGPTGAGKTTTLACLLDRINSQRGCRIITVEDPIEYVHESKVATVDQREVYADTTSFAAALKYVLRQDPDVILVGELRDLETTSAAITAAETGHLVLGTMHTNDATSVVDRIIDVFHSHQQAQVRSQLAAALLGVVSQRLLPRADGSGRVAAFEVMVATMAIRTMIRDNKMHQAPSVMETNKHEGMTTLDRSLASLYEAGVITQHDALHYIRDPRLIKGSASSSSS